MAEFMGYPVLGRKVDHVIDSIPMTVITDAKDVYDRCSSDTSSYGSQKSLAFTIAWLRAMLQRPNTLLRWTSTQNMIIDCGTKEMDVEHLHKIPQACEWSAKYVAAFVKQGKTKAVKKTASVVMPSALPGDELQSNDPMFGHVLKLGDETGWYEHEGVVTQVARNAKSFQTPRPRFATAEYPLRSSFARFDSTSGGVWRRLETDVEYEKLANPQGLFGGTAAILVSCF